MGLQVIQDSNGKNAGVFIPYREWIILKRQHKDLADMEDNDINRAAILNNIRKGIEEVKKFKKGKLKAISAKDFLNGL